jgi:hypothetical protein
MESSGTFNCSERKGSLLPKKTMNDINSPAAKIKELNKLKKRMISKNNENAKIKTLKESISEVHRCKSHLNQQKHILKAITLNTDLNE